MADFLTRADLEAVIGSQRVLQYFDDDNSGTLDNDELVILDQILGAAEGLMYSKMLRGWARDSVIEFVASDDDPLFKTHIAWIAAELAAERRPEFLNDQGRGQHWTQYERAISYFDSVSKSKERMAGRTAPRGTTSGGDVSPAPPSGSSAQFVFAPSRARPNGTGGF